MAPLWMYLSHTLECKLRDVGHLVWLGQHYVFTMKQNFFIRWIKCISELSVKSTGTHPQPQLPARHSSSLPSPAFFPSTHLWLDPSSFLSWCSLPGGLAQPAHLPQMAVVPIKTITLSTPESHISQWLCPPHSGTSGSTLTLPCLIRLSEATKIITTGWQTKGKSVCPIALILADFWNSLFLSTLE